MQAKKELNLDELDKVSGGKQYDEYLPTCGPQIDIANSVNYIGQNVYVVNKHATSQWAFCLLKNAIYDESTNSAEYTIQTININSVFTKVLFGTKAIGLGEEATVKSKSVVLFAQN